MKRRKRSGEGIRVNSDDSDVKKRKMDVDEMIGGGFQDDDESLAVIAAMMLSCRFDSSCIGYSGSRMPTSPELGPESSRCSENAKESNGENCRIGAVRRTLRPKKHNASVRKRRRFHEVSYEDVDPYSVLKQRIQVFCTLDRAWSEGVVKDYDPSKRLHYIKYSNHDEEWLNLEQARFKLLVFPSEIISKAGRERPGLGAEQKKKEGDMEGIDGNFHCHSTESVHAISWLSQQMQGGELTGTDFLDDFDPSILLELKEPRGVSLSHGMISNESPNNFPVSIRSADDATINMVVDNCSVESRDWNASLVYSRKRFHKRTEGVNDTQRIDFDPGGSSYSVTILPSLSDGKGALEVFDMAENPVKCIQVRLKLRPLPQTHVFASELLSFCHGCFFQEFGKVMAVWPMVEMEIIVVDNSRGLKLLLFEGCLSLAVSFACLIIKTFSEDNQESKLTKYEMPFTSIHLKLSGLYDRRHMVDFLLSRFLRLDVSKWRFLEESLKQHCVTMRLLPVTECTYANINTLPSRSIPKLNTSFIDSLMSFKGFTGHSFLDIQRQHTSVSSVYMYMNTGLPYLYEKNGKLPLCAFSSTAASPILLSLHLKLLIEKNPVSVCLKKTFPITSEDCPGYPGKLSYGSSFVEDASEQVSEISLDTLKPSLDKAATGSVRPSFTPSEVRVDALSVSIDSDWLRTFDVFQASNVSQGNMEKKSGAVAAPFKRFPYRTDSWRFLEKPRCSFPEDSSSNRSDGGYNDSQNITPGHAGRFAGGMDQLFDEGGLAAESSSHLAGKMKQLSVNSTSPRSMCHQNLQSSVTTKSDHQQNLRQEDLTQNVSAGGYRFCSKPRSCRRARPYTNLRTSGANRLFDAAGCRNGLQDPLICFANVLITTGDRGWRECGAQVGLESDEQMFCSISVTLSGVIKYMHKAYHPLQPGTTRRHTRATTWKGGNEWTLEFTDRTQWSRFKVLYEECYNRNIQASSARNIPIPGVRLIADNNVAYNNFPFIRTSSKYIRQVGTEVDMAMDPFRVLYDMDSSDEEWILKNRDFSNITGSVLPEVTYDMFERVIDMLEKLAYSRKCEFFTNDEIEKFMANLGPLCVIKPIHDYWQHKRQKKGLPLIRQFQPALWEHFQQQLKEWEEATDELHSTNSRYQTSGCSVNKPSMFAFCLRPRGLEVAKKWSKKRSHRKFMFTGSQNVSSRERGKKFRRLSVGDEKAPISYRHSDSSSQSQTDAAMTGILTMTSDGARNNQQPKLCKNNPEKTGGTLLFPHNSEMIPLSEEKKSRKTAVNRWTGDMYRCSDTKHSASGKKYLTDVVRLSEASSISQRASNMAKLKREKAHQLLHKADLALHKATVALMIAESMQASENALIGKG